MQALLNKLQSLQLFKNEPIDWLLAFLILFVCTFVLWGMKRWFSGRLKADSNGRHGGILSAIAGAIARSSLLLFFIISIHLAAWPLQIPESIRIFLQKAASFALIIQIGLWGNYFITLALKRFFKTTEEEKQGTSGLDIVIILIRFAFWVGILLLLLENLGLNVSTLIAGMGVGGIAIGLATQNILGDLFASLSILLDKPFQVGDFIIVNEHMGVVEKIGLKTTRLRSLNGEQLIFSNNDLLQSRIRNFQNIYERRALSAVGVTYDTPPEKLRKIPQILQDAIEASEKTRFERAHFKSYGDFALIFEYVYFVMDKEYRAFMDEQQEINLRICEAFKAEGIDFAFPTQTIHLQSSSNPVQG